VILRASDLLSLCRGLAGVQRAGCIAGAAKDVYDTPAAQLRLCAQLSAVDALACVRGVGNQAYSGRPRRELALIRGCSALPAAAREGCIAWFGRTFNVLENGRFASRDCPRAREASDRAACAAGARRWRQPLVTFA
jgi:hypothetical protein